MIFVEKDLFCSINWPNFIAWFFLLHEILGIMCIVIVCEPACDVINFEISKLYNLFCIYLASYVCNLCTCLLIHLRESKKSFITFSTLILYLKLWTSIFGSFGILSLLDVPLDKLWISLFVASPSMDACYKIFWSFGRKTFYPASIYSSIDSSNNSASILTVW